MMTKGTDEKDELLKILNELGKGSKFLWIIFILTLTPTIFNGMQSMSYVFTTEVPDHWCAVPELTAANWTEEQIKTISSDTPCEMYNYNYTRFAQMGYENAVKDIEEHDGRRPPSSSCSQHSFKNTGRTTIVEEWDLVCDNAANRANTYMALSLGKLIGAGFFGVFADLHGRKLTFVIGIFILVIVGPATAYVPWFWAFLVLRFLTGISLCAIAYSSMTTLTESSGSRHRQWMGIAFNAGYPIGTALIAGFAYFVKDWRHLQLVISLPSLVLLLHAWFMPESPRWLISQDRRDEAHGIIQTYSEPLRKSSKQMSTQPEIHDKSTKLSDPKATVSEGFIRNNLKSLRILFSHVDLRRRAFIMYFSWMTSSLCYYVMALNVDNFSVNPYLYVLIMGLSEIPAYLVPSAILMIMGRRHASALLYLVGGICLLCLLTIPRGHTAAIMGVALTGRFALSAVYAIIILYTSELFPTVIRNSAVGTSSVMAHVGTISAPYVADLLGQVYWWAPSTLCGILALIAGLSCLVLPETRKRPLADSVEEETASGRGTVSLKKLCSK